jgi:hypothetical protein
MGYVDSQEESREMRLKNAKARHNDLKQFSEKLKAEQVRK